MSQITVKVPVWLWVNHSHEAQVSLGNTLKLHFVFEQVKGKKET